MKVVKNLKKVTGGTSKLDIVVHVAGILRDRMVFNPAPSTDEKKGG